MRLTAADTNDNCSLCGYDAIILQHDLRTCSFYEPWYIKYMPTLHLYTGDNLTAFWQFRLALKTNLLFWWLRRLVTFRFLAPCINVLTYLLCIIHMIRLTVKDCQWNIIADILLHVLVRWKIVVGLFNRMKRIFLSWSTNHASATFATLLHFNR